MFIEEDKEDCRSLYRSLRASVAPEVRTERDMKIIDVFRSTEAYRESLYVLLYAAKGWEINLDLLAIDAVRDGKRIAFPKCGSRPDRMRFFLVNSMNDLHPGRFGIYEPDDGCDEYLLREDGSAVCLVPGIVFDQTGYRIGFGKGYYDRFLPSFRGKSFGVAYDEFVISKTPHSLRDRRVDYLLTENGVRKREG